MLNTLVMVRWFTLSSLIFVLLVKLVCLDGVMHMWKTASNFARPDMSLEGAHVKGTESGSIVFSVDGRTVLTRGGDDTVKCMCTYFGHSTIRLSTA